MKCGITVTASLVLGMCLVSCATRHHHDRREECPPPAWTQNPKTSDSVNFYRIGSATGEPTAAAAREAAYKDALRQISQTILREALGSAPARGGAPVPLAGAEIVPGCSVAIQTPTGFDGWVQVGFPIAEKNKVVESLKPKTDR